ncbi:cytochrome c-type biogenesis protein [Endozoicomonadaceae bacterium StTr2]
MQGRVFNTLIAALAALIFSAALQANVEVYNFDKPEDRVRFYSLTDELRCPKCQNQSIADSDAPIATDLRREVHRMIQEGNSDDDIVNFMVKRYGDFVRYTPALTNRTWILWGGPLLLLLLGAFAIMRMVRKNQTAAVSDEPEETTQEDKAARMQRAEQMLKERD